MEIKKKFDLSPLMAECRKRLGRVGLTSDHVLQGARQHCADNQARKREKHFMRRRLMGIAEEDNYAVYQQLKQDLARGHYEEDVDEYLNVAQEILNELKSEECVFEEDCEEQLSFMNSRIVCPVCLRLPATVDANRLVCECGLNFPLPCPLTLADIEGLLDAHCTSHASSCTSPSRFLVQNQDSRLNLLLLCLDCGYSGIVLQSLDGSADVEMT